MIDTPLTPQRDQEQATITCPECGEKSLAPIPEDQCQFFYVCPHCKTRLRPKGEDCCVFCSFSDTPCPSSRHRGSYIPHTPKE